jgi:hypothetical protein
MNRTTLGIHEQQALLKAVDDPVTEVLFRDALAYRKSHCLQALTAQMVNASGIRDVVELPAHLYGLKYELDFLLEKKPLLKAEDGNVMLAKVFCYGQKWMEEHHGQKLKPLEVGMIARATPDGSQLMLGGPSGEMLEELRQMRGYFQHIKATVSRAASARSSARQSALQSAAGSEDEG